MSLYLDASLLVSVLSREQASARVRDWLSVQATTDLVISDWVATEVASALAMKVRMQALTRCECASALAAFAKLSLSFEVRPISRIVFQTAATFCGSHALGLRAGDALHLAACRQRADTLCTLDRRLAAAATALDVPALLV